MTAAPVVTPEAETDTRTRFAPRYNLILLDDDDHTYAYVVGMLMDLFGFPLRKAFLCACEVDATGRVILLTGSFERCELGQEQIHSYGADPAMRRSAGAMSAIVEPMA